MAEEDGSQPTAWNSVQLKEKELEPDKTINSERVTRNLQLGNWPKKDMIFLYHELERGVNLESFPDNRNGWLYKQFGRMTFEKIDAKIVASNSSDGFVRIATNTQTRIQKVKDDTPTKGFFNNLIGGNQQNNR
jgi:hypothetical protein